MKGKKEKRSKTQEELVPHLLALRWKKEATKQEVEVVWRCWFGSDLRAIKKTVISNYNIKELNDANNLNEQGDRFSFKSSQKSCSSDNLSVLGC
jgi:hypothetical protein